MWSRLKQKTLHSQAETRNFQQKRLTLFQVSLLSCRSDSHQCHSGITLSRPPCCPWRTLGVYRKLNVKAACYGRISPLPCAGGMKVSAGPSLLLSAIVLLGFPQLPKARCEWDDWLFWRPASLFTTSKKDRQPSPVKGAGSQVTSSARSTVPFRVATTTATTVSPTEKTRKARAGTADWWRSLFSLERFRSISRRVVPNENDKELTRTSSPPSSGPSSTATTTASPKRDEDGKLPYSGKSEEMGEWMNAKSPKEIGE
ncbi:hypothetical protein CSUI_005040, partial [Cystoisospora suis]